MKQICNMFKEEKKGRKKRRNEKEKFYIMFFTFLWINWAHGRSNNTLPSLPQIQNPVLSLPSRAILVSWASPFTFPHNPEHSVTISKLFYTLKNPHILRLTFFSFWSFHWYCFILYENRYSFQEMKVIKMGLQTWS